MWYKLKIVVAIALASMTLSQIAVQAQSPEGALSSSRALDEDKLKTTTAASWQGKRVALRGRDVVSFHQESGPVKGSKDYVAEWDKTKWRFSSEENRTLFLKDPKKYVPGFGGYCPVALAEKKIKVGRESQHTVVDGTLYLNYNKDSLERFRQGPREIISQARLHF